MSRPGELEEIHKGFVVLCKACGDRQEIPTHGDMKRAGNLLRMGGWITINGYWHCEGCLDGRAA